MPNEGQPFFSLARTKEKFEKNNMLQFEGNAPKNTERAKLNIPLIGCSILYSYSISAFLTAGATPQIDSHPSCLFMDTDRHL